MREGAEESKFTVYSVKPILSIRISLHTNKQKLTIYKNRPLGVFMKPLPKVLKNKQRCINEFTEWEAELYKYVYVSCFARTFSVQLIDVQSVGS